MLDVVLVTIGILGALASVSFKIHLLFKNWDRRRKQVRLRVVEGGAPASTTQPASSMDEPNEQRRAGP